MKRSGKLKQKLVLKEFFSSADFFLKSSLHESGAVNIFKGENDGLRLLSNGKAVSQTI